MGTSEVQRGAVAERVRANVKRIRQDRGLTGAQLAELLGKLGRPMQPSAVNKIETGARRVDVDDLIALSLALNTTPNRLLLNEPSDREAATEVAPRVTAAGFQAWAWANGKQVLLPSAGVLGQSNATFSELQHEFLRHAQPPAQHPAQEAADDLRGRIGTFLSCVDDYTKERQNESDGRAPVPTDHVIVVAEQLRQGLQRLEAWIAQLLDESPLADQPGYGQAFFASVEVHQQTVERLNAAREQVHRTQAAHANDDISADRVRHALYQARERLAAALASRDTDSVERWEDKSARLTDELDMATRVQAKAHHLAAQAEDSLKRAESDLYGLRRMMLIRSMVPPLLPPALVYVDSLHPNEVLADQVQQLWKRLNHARLVELAAASTSRGPANAS